MRYLLALSLLAACLEPLPDDTAPAQQQFLPDAPPPPTIDAPLASFARELVDPAGRRSPAVRVGQRMWLTGSRVLGAAPAASTLSLTPNATPGWYLNAHPAGAFLLVQLGPGDNSGPQGISPIDARAAGTNFGTVVCGIDDAQADHLVTQSSTASTVTAAAAPGVRIGDPCWTSTTIGTLLGFVDSVTPTTTVIARASPLTAWIATMDTLGQVRRDAHFGGAGIAGPYAVYVAPAADPTRRMCMDIPGSAVTAQTTVNQWPCHHGKNQQFFLDFRLDAARPRLISNQSGLCLDVRGAVTTSGADLQQYGCHASTNQRFARESPPILTLPPRHRYRPQHAPGMCLAARSGNDAFGGGLSIRQMTCAAPMAAHEQWILQLVSPS